MALLNYTTKIDPDKTAGEIAKMLSMAGANGVLTEYEDGYVKALSFKMTVDEKDIGFKLPCDWKPVQEVLEEQWHKNRRIDRSREQAVRTAWRIVKDWVEAQLAIIETRMVTTQEVFLPYAVMKDGRTLAETVQQDSTFLLGEGK